MFHSVNTAYDQQLAIALIRAIDRSEALLLAGAFDEDADPTLYPIVQVADTPEWQGAFFATEQGEGLHIGIAFTPDLPDDQVAAQLLAWLYEARVQCGGQAVIWCRHDNPALHNWLQGVLHLSPNIHASREMTISQSEFAALTPPKDIGLTMHEYDQRYLPEYIELMEAAFAPVAGAGIFIGHESEHHRLWSQKASQDRFFALHKNNVPVAVCLLNDYELELLGVHPAAQRKGVGSIACYHAIQRIFFSSPLRGISRLDWLLAHPPDLQDAEADMDMVLYVVDWNEAAFCFYHHMGLRVTGHSKRFIWEES